MSKRRTLDSFFQPLRKKQQLSPENGTAQRNGILNNHRVSGLSQDSIRPEEAKILEDGSEGVGLQDARELSSHTTYPFPIPYLPSNIQSMLGFAPAAEPSVIKDQPDLDLLYFQPYIPKEIARDLFEFLRQELFFYRVKYMIKRGGVETLINTPRFTTVFGVDETSRFTADGSLVDSSTGRPVPKDRYRCKPRPIPQCLNELRKLTEGSTNTTYNFCLVNYYASGSDSISYHSDDERFLGSNPSIASFSLGAKRDFLMKHKPPTERPGAPGMSTATSTLSSETAGQPLKFPLASGDMILMRGPTQATWLHSIPKRKGRESDRGRINITFRKAMVRGGTENYYTYNVGMSANADENGGRTGEKGEVYRWDGRREEMVQWLPPEIKSEN
ncbi:hypothetical protein L228DRAFT_282447 [Xylona heveae TC161]|uniref:Fe2OG dioxygenase domain-containing protein n=1 Tax=Xylona heveae (strain CBS 132557 / TC161) TaxID=1328760 RepID=A0A165HN22_XYLHT|nr:hypothetical protein L228DRAFT_282447 [Xylona heveae TC161]KZF23759.1 hypothetical protein L228DRAFT_282447 [Xylona heveae TC161]